MQAVVEAIKTNNLPALEEALGNNLETCVDSLGNLPLTLAARIGAVDAATWLLDKGALLGARDSSGRTALHFAVMYEQMGMIDLLMARGAQVGVEDDLGSTPMEMGLNRGRVRAALRLLDRARLRGLGDPCHSLLLKYLKGGVVPDIEVDHCFTLLGHRRIAPVAELGVYFDEVVWDLLDPTGRPTEEAPQVAQDRLVRFAEQYACAAAGGPDAEAILNYLLCREEAAPVETWLLGLRPTAEAGSQIAWEGTLPFLSSRLLGQGNQEQMLKRWLALGAPFLELERQLELIGRSFPSLNFAMLFKVLDYPHVLGLYNRRRWYTLLAGALSQAKGVSGKNPLWQLLTKALGVKSQAFYRENPRRLRMDAAGVLATHRDDIFAAFGGAEPFLDSLSPEERRAFAEDDFSSFHNDPAGWFALAKALDRDGLLPKGLPQKDEAVYRLIGEWVVEQKATETALVLLQRAGDEYGRRHWGTARATSTLQAVILGGLAETWLNAIERLQPVHIVALGDAALLTRIALVAAERNCAKLFKQALQNLGLHLSEPLDPELLERHLGMCIDVWCAGDGEIPAVLLEQWWQRTDATAARKSLALKCFRMLVWQNHDSFRLLLENWLGEAPTVVDEALATREDLDSAECRWVVHLWPLLGTQSRTRLARLCAGNIADAWEYASAEERVAMEQLLALGLEQSPVKVIDALGEQPQWAFRLLTDAVLPPLQEHIEAHAGKRAMDASLAQGLAKVSVNALVASGLLTSDVPPVRDVAVRGLCASADPAALDLLITLLRDHGERWNDVQRGNILDRIEALGGDTTGLDPLSDVDATQLEKYAARSRGRRKSQVEVLLGSSEELPLPSVLLDWGLDLFAAAEWGGAPRYSRQVFGLIRPTQQAALVEQLLQAWVSGGGLAKQTWLLRLAGAFPDDRLVPLLSSAINEWHKRKFQVAVQVAHSIGEMDTVYALYTLDNIRRATKIRHVVREAASEALAAAAQRRGIALGELADELVPTLDLGTDGLLLDVGPYQYRVELKPDLGLRVTQTTTGKVTVSLPKAKKEEDPEKRAAADDRFKLLKKNVKPVVQQLKERFEEAFDCGKSWQGARWQQLFLSHPILQLVGRTLVWVQQQSEGDVTFRIAEDTALIDREDGPVSLTNAEVRLWHPLEASPGEREDWQQHFADYELTPFIDQFDSDVFHLAETERAQDELTRFHGKAALWGNFKRAMEKWGFKVGDQDGAHVFRYERFYPLTGIEVAIEMEDCDVAMGWDNPCVLGAVKFSHRPDPERWDSQGLKLGEVPPRLISSLIGRLERLVEAA